MNTQHKGTLFFDSTDGSTVQQSQDQPKLDPPKMAAIFLSASTFKSSNSRNQPNSCRIPSTPRTSSQNTTKMATPSTIPSTSSLEPSALTNLIASTPTATTPLSATTIQILHNLQHQHLWTSLKVHDLELPNPPASSTETTTAVSEPTTSPVFLISGIPPHRVYTHPDEQIYMLERGLRDDDVELERMFVLPSVQGQSWSLRRMVGVFDSLPGFDEEEGGSSAAALGEVDEEEKEENKEKEGSEKADKLAEYYRYRETARRTGEWGGKRILLSMVDRGMGGDGTVVYYVVHEGAVKPRQN